MTMPAFDSVATPPAPIGDHGEDRL